MEKCRSLGFWPKLFGEFLSRAYQEKERPIRESHSDWRRRRRPPPSLSPPPSSFIPNNLEGRRNLTLDDDGIGGEGRSMDAERDMAGRVEGTLVPDRTKDLTYLRSLYFRMLNCPYPGFLKVLERLFPVIDSAIFENYCRHRFRQIYFQTDFETAASTVFLRHISANDMYHSLTSMRLVYFPPFSHRGLNVEGRIVSTTSVIDFATFSYSQLRQQIDRRRNRRILTIGTLAVSRS